MYELTEIMRLRESRELAAILNRMREGIHTSNDLCILRTRMIEDSDPSYPRNVPHLFIKNKSVNDFNLTIFNSAPGRKFTVKAIDNVIGAETLKQHLLA